MIFSRLLQLVLPMGQSAFLWGARKTGKSTYLSSHFPHAVYYDLLKTENFTRFLAAPYLLREEVMALSEPQSSLPIIIDEIQKIPQLLNEVHWLIEHQARGFILCGSSARKLKRGAANLLGGRAWRFHFYPLVYKEIPDFQLLRALNQGLIPSHYLSSYPTRHLRAYVNDYLIEEIQGEGLVRNLSAFARFMELMGYTSGQQLNYANIARDCGVDAKTVKAYYQIVEDTLLGYLIYPFHKKIKRELIQATPKFYLFDTGVAGYLKGRTLQDLRGNEAGDAFEHFIFMELRAYLGLQESDLPIQYWRSKQGHEVDFVLYHGDLAIEVKLSSSPHKTDLKGLLAFCVDYQPKYALVVCQAPRKRVIEDPTGGRIEILPWQEFLENLWMDFYGV